MDSSTQNAYGTVWDSWRKGPRIIHHRCDGCYELLRDGTEELCVDNHCAGKFCEGCYNAHRAEMTDGAA